MGRPEVPSAAGADPELIGLPWSAARRISHLHLGATALTPHLQFVARHPVVILATEATEQHGKHGPDRPHGHDGGTQHARKAARALLCLPCFRVTISVMVPGVILAAGRSSRMGRAKALLPCAPDGETFVHRLARTLSAGGVGEVLVVGRPDAAGLRAEVAAMAVARFVANDHADAGQLSSVLAGLEAADAPGTRGLLVTPVDAPLIAVETVAALLGVFSSSGALIVRAVYLGRHGHPVVFSRAVFDDLRRADPDVGAKAVLRAHERAIVNVEVDDPGVVADVDTREDYRALFGRHL
jgi:molybdenum cofactor cytidylyltransferase